MARARGVKCTHDITILVTAVIVLRRFGTEIWVWYGNLAGHCGNVGRYMWEFGFDFWVHSTRVGPFPCWCGLTRSPLLLLLNVHDSRHEITGRSRPPAFFPRAPLTGPTAPFTIYLLQHIRKGRGAFNANQGAVFLRKKYIMTRYLSNGS